MSAVDHLTTVYGERAESILQRIRGLWSDSELPLGPHQQDRWSEKDIVLITYGDQVQTSAEPTLASLSEFLLDQNLEQVINTVHLLPFCPYSSDDGFSVIDYLTIDPNLGDWDNVKDLGQHFDLMFDFVVNHISQHSRWYQGFLKGEPPYDQFFHVVDPSLDLSMVTRPRSLPLLTAAETPNGTKHVWTTFSDDQIDLDFGEPDVLVEMTAVLLEYIRRGARIVRLDAIAFLWKQIGTSCVHLPETHAIVKFWRALFDEVAPNVVLLTETNVPHKENISYFGDGDEAHMVYQFALPPLLIDAVLRQDATPLMNWLAELPPPAPKTTFFNFTASHDGVGLRPLEGLIAPERLMQLVDDVKQSGGMVSTRRSADGNDIPYEMNVAYVDAVGSCDDPDSQAKRFLATQGVMLALQGIPAVYFHSLVGTQNDHEGVAASGQPRRINRHKYARSELDAKLNDKESLPSVIFRGYRHLLDCRIAQPAFHPDGPQRVLAGGPPQLVAFERTSVDSSQIIVVLVNLGQQSLHVDLAQWSGDSQSIELLTDTPISRAIDLAPFQVAWLCSCAAKPCG